jgi:hypothetical protein
VATSIKSNLGVGCPSKSDPMVLNFKRSSFLIWPSSAQQAYKIGAECPLDKINLSFSNALGCFGSYYMPLVGWKNKVAMISAFEEQEVGWLSKNKK